MAEVCEVRFYKDVHHENTFFRKGQLYVCEVEEAKSLVRANVASIVERVTASNPESAFERMERRDK